jgi:hypothetical protein
MDTQPTRELSIEYSHIYTNQQIGEEHKLSIRELKNALGMYSPHDAVLTVLIDDYSFPDPTFNYEVHRLVRYTGI